MGLLRLSEPRWKVWALLCYPELQLRIDDSDWRRCLQRKAAEPKVTVSTVQEALVARGENIWKFKNHWCQCATCDYICFIGECGSGNPLQTVTCPGCGGQLGGQAHVLTVNAKVITTEDAETLVCKTRSCVRGAQVIVRRLGGHACTIQVARDCTVLEAKAEIWRELGIPVSQQALVVGENTLSNDQALLHDSDTIEAVL